MKEQFLRYGKGKLVLLRSQDDLKINGRYWLRENPFGVRSDWEEHVLERGAPMYRLMFSKSSSKEWTEGSSSTKNVWFVNVACDCISWVTKPANMAQWIIPESKEDRLTEVSLMIVISNGDGSAAKGWSCAWAAFAAAIDWLFWKKPLKLKRFPHHTQSPPIILLPVSLCSFVVIWLDQMLGSHEMFRSSCLPWSFDF